MLNWNFCINKYINKKIYKWPKITWLHHPPYKLPQKIAAKLIIHLFLTHAHAKLHILTLKSMDFSTLKIPVRMIKVDFGLTFSARRV